MADEERLADLQEDVEKMRILDEMVKTPGWQWLMDRFAELRKDYYMKLLNAGTEREIIVAQCAIKSLNVILSDPERKIESDVDRFIRTGGEAVKELKKVKVKKVD